MKPVRSSPSGRSINRPAESDGAFFSSSAVRQFQQLKIDRFGDPDAYQRSRVPAGSPDPMFSGTLDSGSTRSLQPLPTLYMAPPAGPVGKPQLRRRLPSLTSSHVVVRAISAGDEVRHRGSAGERTDRTSHPRRCDRDGRPGDRDSRRGPSFTRGHHDARKLAANATETGIAKGNGVRPAILWTVYAPVA